MSARWSLWPPCPDAPDNVKPVREVAGVHVDQVHIGSCSNGRYEDIKAAHDVLMAMGGKVNPDTRVIIPPAPPKYKCSVFMRAGI